MNDLNKNKILRFFIILSISFAILTYFYNTILLWFCLGLSLPLLLMVLNDIRQNKHSLLRNFPLIGRLRWVFENERSKIQQYFIENDVTGTPFNREKRNDVYQKSKGEQNTTPFGTQLDVYANGYEYIKHSLYPVDSKDIPEPRVVIGSPLCSKPYSASIFNISAMSYGSLSDAAIKALNGGAKLGNFYHNTGEGGISPYHLENEGDLCFQIGTGYFGAGKTIDGKRYFDDEAFIKSVSNPSVKMVEIKLSQGAKPAHGGILPASKNTKEIAEIRGVEPNEDIMSPPYHTAFSGHLSMIDFINKLRELSGGIPIGIKLCIGDEWDFIMLIRAMEREGVYPDFISIDGSEGGTGAAPLVYTNNVGMPLLDALKIVDETLKDCKLRDKIKVIASGKASNSFDIIKLLAMGADIINAARAFMFSMGCIMARECHKNTCPVGIATQDRKLIYGLNVEDKKVRVFTYHKAIIHEVKELVGAMGLYHVSEITQDKLAYRNNEGLLETNKN